MFRQGAPGSFFQTLVAEIGIDARKAEQFTKNQLNICSSITNQRLSISGVDTEEEAMNLLQRTHRDDRILRWLLYSLARGILHLQLRKRSFVIADVVQHIIGHHFICDSHFYTPCIPQKHHKSASLNQRRGYRGRGDESYPLSDGLQSFCAGCYCYESDL